MQLAYRVFRLFQEKVHVPVGKICRQQIEQLIISAADKIIQVAFALNQALATALDPRFDTEVIACGALGVEVPDECGCTFAGREPGKVDGGGGFSNPSLDVVCGDDFQTCGSPANGWMRTVSGTGPDCPAVKNRRIGRKTLHVPGVGAVPGRQSACPWRAAYQARPCFRPPSGG